ncbi:hypothetical protein H6G64_04000 [Calothrix sp. FACHB-156]|nr:hypothetical protein [Calothrix sp. FACHB-156]
MDNTEIENQIAKTIRDAYINLDGIDFDHCSLIIESHIQVYYEPPHFDQELTTGFQIPGGFRAWIFYDDTFAAEMNSDYAVNTRARVANFVGVSSIGICGIRDAYRTLLKRRMSQELSVTSTKLFLCLQDMVERRRWVLP